MICGAYMEDGQFDYVFGSKPTESKLAGIRVRSQSPCVYVGMPGCVNRMPIRPAPRGPDHSRCQAVVEFLLRIGIGSKAPWASDGLVTIRDKFDGSVLGLSVLRRLSFGGEYCMIDIIKHGGLTLTAKVVLYSPVHTSRDPLNQRIALR